MSDRLVDASSLCWTFAQTGRCPRGASCKWAHRVLEKEPSDSVCRAWLLWGTCPRKEHCSWDHPPVCMRSAPEVQGLGQPYGFAVGSGPCNPCGGIWANGLLCAPMAAFAPPPADDFSPSDVTCGATAGQKLLSLLQASDKLSDENVINEDTDINLKPWEDSEPGENQDGRAFKDLTKISPVLLDVKLEDMPDAWGAWDQFEVNRKRFGVKSTFKEDLSQYTTVLDTAHVPDEVKQEAERVATAIEEEHQASGGLDGASGDEHIRTAASDSEDDEEAKFAAVSRYPCAASMQKAAQVH